MPITLNPAANTKRASTNANVSPLVGGLVVALVPAMPVVGTPVAATLPDAKTGTFQFFRVDAQGVKTNVGAASAAGAVSHSYTPVIGDLGYTIGCDVVTTVDGKTSSVVTSSPASLPGQPAAPVLTALANAVSVAWVAPANNGSPILATEYTSIEGVTTTLTMSPQTIPAVAGVATTGAIRSRNAVGYGPYSAQATAVTPLSGALRIAALGQRAPDSRMASAGYTRFTSEYPFQVDKPHSSVTLSFVNWWITSGYATGTGGAITIESLTVWVGSAAVSPGFPDGPQLVMADMATDAKSNPISAASLGLTEFVPGVNYWMKVSWYAPAGYLPRNAVGWLAPTVGVKFAWYDPTSTALGNVSGPGAFTFGAATGLPVSTPSGGPVPFVLGTPVDGIDDSVLIESDSNGAGTGDVIRALAVKGGGHAERAVMDYARKFASINFSKANTTATQWSGTNGMAVVRAYYAYTKTIYNRLGGNDFLDAATATTLANYKTNQLAIIARYRAAGITKCVLGAIWTRTTDATGTPWTTLAGQTVAIGREPASAIPPDGGLTLQANKWLSEQADAVSAMRVSFVPFTTLRDASTNKWPVTSLDGQTTGIANTTDGTHGTPLGHEKGGAELYPFFSA